MPRKIIRFIAFLLCFSLIFEQTGFAQVAGQMDLSGYFSGLRSSFAQDKFRPLHLRYLSYDNQANTFKLLLDKGDSEKGLSRLGGTVPLEEATKTLLNYFFIGVTLPNDSFWVNLRPDDEKNIIDPYLAHTDIGKILLEADLHLKKDTALATSPRTPEGRKYWDKLYKKAEELFGYDNITIPTLTRPWIVPGEIIIRETKDNAYIYKATLKVMLEQDYLKDSATYNFKDPRLKALNEYSSQLIRELIIPKLTKEVNSSKKYASLRQVYYSLILAQWFKMRFYGRGGLYSWLIDKRNLNGLASKELWSKTAYFNAYQQSFKDGEYNIQEPRQTPFGQTVRSYFSGGIAFSNFVPTIQQYLVNANGKLGNVYARAKSYIARASVIGGKVTDPAAVQVYAGEALAPQAQPPAPGVSTVADSAEFYGVTPDATAVLIGLLVRLAQVVMDKISKGQPYQEELNSSIAALAQGRWGLDQVMRAVEAFRRQEGVTPEALRAINEAIVTVYLRDARFRLPGLEKREIFDISSLRLPIRPPRAILQELRDPVRYQAFKDKYRQILSRVERALAARLAEEAGIRNYQEDISLGAQAAVRLRIFELLAMGVAESAIEAEITSEFRSGLQDEINGAFLSIGTEVEVWNEEPYNKGPGVYPDMLAKDIWQDLLGLRLGWDELVEFALPPSLSARMQVAMIQSMINTGLIPGAEVFGERAAGAGSLTRIPVGIFSLHISVVLPVAQTQAHNAWANVASYIELVKAILYTSDGRLNYFANRWKPLDIKGGVDNVVDEKGKKSGYAIYDRDGGKIRLEYRSGDVSASNPDYQRAIPFVQVAHNLMYLALRAAADTQNINNRLLQELLEALNDFIAGVDKWAEDAPAELRQGFGGDLERISNPAISAIPRFRHSAGFTQKRAALDSLVQALHNRVELAFSQADALIKEPADSERIDNLMIVKRLRELGGPDIESLLLAERDFDFSDFARGISARNSILNRPMPPRDYYIPPRDGRRNYYTGRVESIPLPQPRDFIRDRIHPVEAITIDLISAATQPIMFTNIQLLEPFGIRLWARIQAWIANLIRFFSPDARFERSFIAAFQREQRRLAYGLGGIDSPELRRQINRQVIAGVFRTMPRGELEEFIGIFESAEALFRESRNENDREREALLVALRLMALGLRDEGRDVRIEENPEDTTTPGSFGLYAVTPEAAIILALVNLAASLIEKIRNHQLYQEELDKEIISLIDEHGIIAVRKAAAGLKARRDYLDAAGVIDEAIAREGTGWRLHIDNLPPGALGGLTPEQRSAFLSEVDLLIRGISRSTWLEIIKNISGLPGLQWEDIDSEPSLTYAGEGRKKYVFKVSLNLGDGKEINIALATKFASGEGSITDSELYYNQKLQGTGWVPRFGASFISAGRVWYVEEFIKGPTAGEDADNKGRRLDPEVARKCIKTLLDILFYLNPGKTGDFIGPSDFHKYNFVIDENDPGRRVVLVDFGEAQIYKTIEDFLFGVVMYYSGTKGEYLEYLREQLSRFNLDDTRWNVMLQAILAKLKRAKDGTSVYSVKEFNGFFIDRPDCNRAIGAIMTYRHDKRTGQDNAWEALAQAEPQGNGRVKIVSLKKVTRLPGQISFGSYRYDSSKGTITIGDEVAVSGVEIYEAGGNWFTGSGLKGNAIIAVYEDFRGTSRIAVIIKKDLSEEERNKAFRHELIALMGMEGVGIATEGTVEDPEVHKMAATDTSETPTALDVITPEELESALKDLPRGQAIVVATQRPLSQGEASARLQPLRVTDTDILQEKIATGKLEARNIAPLFSFAAPELEQAIRQEIADRINNNKDTDALRTYLSVPQGWLNAQAQEIIEKFDLRRDGIQDEAVKLALDKACTYFKEVFPAEENLLSRFQASHRLLVPGHWLVNALQEYVDKIAEPGFPPLRLVIAVDGEELVAGTIGQSVIISLSLIARLDTIDEIVAVLAHEQAHPEFKLTHNQYGPSGDILADHLREISARRLQEHEADLTAQQKISERLNGLRLHPLALAEALRKIAGPRSQQAVTHGNVSRRIMLMLAALRHHDLEHAGSPSLEANPIPPSWKPASIAPSIEERLLYKNYGRDFKKAVNQASPEITAAVMKELLKTITGTGFNRMIRQPAQKYGYMLYYLEKRAQEEARARRWSRNRVDLLFFSWLEDIHGSTSADDFLKLKAARNRSARRAHSQIRRAALSMLRQSQQPGALAVFNSLISDAYRGRPVAGYNLVWALGLAMDMLISDAQLGQRFFDRAYNIYNESFLTIFNPCLKAVSELQEALNPGIHSNSVRSSLTDIVNLYCHNFTRKHGFLQSDHWYLSQQDFAELIRQLKKAEEVYEATFGLQAFLETAFNQNYDFRNKLLYLSIPSMSEDEIKEILFNTKNEFLEHCLGFLRSRDADAFLGYLKDNAAAEAFYDFLGRGHEPNIKVELQRLFKSDPGLAAWISECLQRFWQSEAFISEESLIERICSGSPEWGLSGAAEEEDESFARADRLDINPQDRQRLAQFLYGLDIILVLPFSGKEAQFSAIERYLESANARSLLGRLPLVYLNRVMSRLPQCANAIQPIGDRFLGLSVYSLARSRIIRIIRDARPADLKLASDIYWGIIRGSHGLYFDPMPAQKQLRTVGQTDYHSQWLLPLNQAYYAFLENNLEEFLNHPQAAIQSFFELDSVLFDAQEKKRILNAYAFSLVDRLPDEALRDFLLQLVKELKITREIYDYFLQKRIKTKEDFLYFKQARDEAVAQVVAGGDLKLTAAVLADSALDHLGREQTIEFFTALLGPEEELRQKAVYLWFLQSLLRGSLMDYTIQEVNEELVVIGPGSNNFMPFEEFMEDLYNASELTKMALLEKLLLGPNGLLHTKQGKRVFVEVLRKHVPVSGSSSGPLADITRASVDVLDAEEIFLALASSLSALILKRPPGGHRQLDDADELAAALSRQLKRLNKTLITGTGGRIDLWRFSYYGRYSEFLKKHSSRLPTGELRLRVEPLAASLADKLKSRLGLTPQISQAGITPAQQQQVQIIDIIMRACQSLGPMGYRFLQIYGQYVDIPAHMQDRFLDVYDSSEGQDKFSAFTTLLNLADRNEEVRRFIEEDLVSIDEKIGGGAIVTVFKITVRNRDEHGNLTDGVHQEVLKIRVPNAEFLVNETADKLLEIVGRLQRSAKGRDKRYYLAARRVLQDVREWVIQDIRDNTFWELDSLYRQAHAGYTASNGMRVSVAPALQPNNKDIKREAFVPGPTLNKVLKWKASGKTLAQLASEEQDPALKEFLLNLERQGRGLEDILRQATQALVEDYARLMAQPLTRREGRDIYILHSDMHFGNAIVSPDLSTVYPIDRNFYLQLHKQDVDFIRGLMTKDRTQAAQILEEIVNYFLGLPQNQNTSFNQGTFSGMRRWLLLRSIGVKVLLQRNKDPFTVMTKVLQELESRGIEIPLSIRIMFKNLLAINAMLRHAQAGSFEEYVRGAPAAGADSSDSTELHALAPETIILAALLELARLFKEKIIDRRQLASRIAALAQGPDDLDKLRAAAKDLVARGADPQAASAINEAIGRGSMAAAEEDRGLPAIALRYEIDPQTGKGRYLIIDASSASGRVVGEADIDYQDEAIVLHSRIIYPEFQNKGFATALTKHLAQEAMTIEQYRNSPWPLKIKMITNPFIWRGVVRVLSQGHIQIMKYPAVEGAWIDIGPEEAEAIAKEPTTPSKLYPGQERYVTPFDLRWSPSVRNAQGGMAPQDSVGQPAVAVSGKGGIDFRALPIVTQPVAISPLNSSIVPRLSSLDLGKEWREIQHMLEAGITPSVDRIKGYVEACIQKEDMDGEIDKVLSCIADILRQEEQECYSTEPALRELLVLLDSDKPAKDWGPKLINIQPLPKEPKSKQN